MAEKEKILVIDDEPVVTRSCRRILAEEGYEVETVESGREGLDRARSGGFSLVMTDLKMPDLDGMKIVEVLRKDYSWLPLVIITGYGTAKTQAQATRLGVDEYIEKPFTPEQITDAVGRALTRARRQLGPVDEDDTVAELVARYENEGGALIQMLLDVQKVQGYLPREWLTGISERVGIPLPRVYQVATFYKAFSLEPRGRHTIQVCTGTACHVRGAPVLVGRISNALGVRPGGTTKDGAFTFETVNCLGCCALGPVMAVDGAYYSDPSPDELGRILDEHRKAG